MVSLNPTPNITDLTLNKALDAVSSNPNTKGEWKIVEGRLEGRIVVSKASSWEDGVKTVYSRFENILGHPLALSNSVNDARHGFNPDTEESKIEIVITDPLTLKELSDLHTWSTDTSNQSNLVTITRERAQEAAKTAKTLTNIDWKVEEDSRMFDKKISLEAKVIVSANDEEEGEKIVKQQLKEQLGSNVLIARGFKRGMPQGKVNVVCSISDTVTLDRLADMQNPQILLVAADNYLRTLASISATLAVTIPEGYRKRDFERHAPDPEKKLDLPLTTVSPEGISFKMTENLVEKGFADGLQTFTQVAAKEIDETYQFGPISKRYVGEVIIPANQAKEFVTQHLKMDPMVYSELKLAYPEQTANWTD